MIVKSQILTVFLFLFGMCQSEQTRKIIGKEVIGPQAAPATIKEIAPLTVGNLKAHENLHNEGWFIIPSSRKSLAYANEKGILNSRESLALMIISLKQSTKTYPAKLTRTIEEMKSFGIEDEKTYLQNTYKIHDATFALARSEKDVAYGSFQKSWENLILGNMTFALRSENNRRKLKALYPKTYKDLKGDLSNLFQIIDASNQENLPLIRKAWSDSFSQGALDFKKKYEESGQADNSLLALVDILAGYAKAFRSGVLSPAGETATKGGESLFMNGVFLPTAAVGYVAGNSLVSTGMSLYYSAGIGYDLVSPNVEAGFLAAFGLIAASATVPTILAGESIAGINHVAVKGGYATARVGGVAGGALGETGGLVASMTYDIVKGSGKTSFNVLESGIVLGYSALTCIPSHLVMASVDSVVILAWDGPRLVVAKISGNIKDLDEAPVGTVIDLNKINDKNVKVEKVTDDPEIINRIIEKEKEDLRPPRKKKPDNEL
ncbi:MAG: hypothetical protein K8R21_05290 [Leptospira sp.]|nr:hypothetical protein [Leptospira sp.]